MSALGVVEHLRNLAADPQNRATIVKVRNSKCTVVSDRSAMFGFIILKIIGFLVLFFIQDQGCLAGLVLFLDNEDVNVVITALEVCIPVVMKI